MTVNVRTCRGRANVQSTQKWEVNNLFVQSIFQFCAVNFLIFSNKICIILIKFYILFR